jgi:hypothetical protein
MDKKNNSSVLITSDGNVIRTSKDGSISPDSELKPNNKNLDKNSNLLKLIGIALIIILLFLVLAVNLGEKSSMIYYLSLWVGANFKNIIFTISITLITFLILLVPLKNKKKFLWNILLSVGFLSYAYWIFSSTSGLMYLYTSSEFISITYGGIFSFLAASSPVIIIKFIKTHDWKWLYSLFIIILTGSAILSTKLIAEFFNIINYVI